MNNLGIKVEYSKVSDGNMSFVWGNEADVIKTDNSFWKITPLMLTV